MEDFAPFVARIGTITIVGLAVYSIYSLFVLMKAFQVEECEASKQVRRDAALLIVCFICSILLHATKTVWDSFRTEHFPLWGTGPILLILLSVLGSAGFRLYHNRHEFLSYRKKK
jgi:magnesium-transporting ATPase (P-type)